jgi:trimeric autotransporter adhesin
MSTLHQKLLTLLIIAAVLLTSVGAAAPAQASPSAQTGSDQGQSLWQSASTMRAMARMVMQPALGLRQYAGYTLNSSGMAALLTAAPLESAPGARGNSIAVALPAPNGEFKTFAIVESPVMEPGLAAAHPEIKTYRGYGIDEPAATVRFDMTPLGFHASVRSSEGAWYIDPYYENSTSLYASYYGADLVENRHGAFYHTDGQGPEVVVDEATYHAADTVSMTGSGFAPGAPISITIYSPDEQFADRVVNATSDEQGGFEASFIADPNGNLDTHIIEASDGTDSGLPATR